LLSIDDMLKNIAAHHRLKVPLAKFCYEVIVRDIPNNVNARRGFHVDVNDFVAKSAGRSEQLSIYVRLVYSPKVQRRTTKVADWINVSRVNSVQLLS
jgi:hypothetical protein